MTTEELEKLVADCRRLGVNRLKGKDFEIELGAEPPGPSDPRLCVHGERMGEVECKLCKAMNRPIRNAYDDPALGVPRMKRHHG